MWFFVFSLNFLLDFLVYLIVDNISKYFLVHRPREQRFDILIFECFVLGFFIAVISVYHHFPSFLIVLLFIQIVGSISTEKTFDDFRRVFRSIVEIFRFVFQQIFNSLMKRISIRRPKKIQPIPQQWKYNYHLKPIRDLRLANVQTTNVLRPGIVNLHGTTCSLNALLQSFASLNQFYSQIQLERAKNIENSFFSTFFQILSQLRNEHSTTSAPVNTSMFIEQLNQIYPGLISSYVQRDLSDLLQRIFDALNNILTRPSIVYSANVTKQIQNPRLTTFSLKFLNKIFVDTESELHRTVTLNNIDSKTSDILQYTDVTWLLHQLQQGSIIKQLFSGQILHAHCYPEDSHVRFRTEPFQILNLVVPSTNISLERLLLQLTKIESIDLSSSSRVRSQKMLSNFPEILCIHLDRSSATSSRLSTQISIEPDRLIDLSSIHQLTWFGLTSNPIRYRLMAVCLHLFSTKNEAHDVCLYRSDKSRWFLSDDERVTEIHQINELFRNSYVTENSSLFFFERCS